MIVCFRGTGPIAAGIRWQTRGKYAHAGWLCRDGSFIEAHGKTGVAKSRHPWVINDGEADVFGVHGLTYEQHKRIESFLRLQVGEGYDWLGVVRFLSGVNRNNYRRWFCSELVAEACEEAHVPLLLTQPWRISPATLAWSTELTPIARAVTLPWWNAKFNSGQPINE